MKPEFEDDRSRRLAALERALPFFRIAADEDVIGVILEEFARVPTEDFERACRAAIRAETAGNPIVAIRRALKPA